MLKIGKISRGENFRPGRGKPTLPPGNELPKIIPEFFYR
jgi:hypothetical protein